MAAPVAGVPGVNPVTAQIPNFVLQQMQAQRQQQLAAALQDQGMAPVEYDPHGRISWTQGLAKLLQTGMGLSLGNQVMKEQAGLQQQGMQAMGQAYGMGAPQGSPQALAAALSPQTAGQGQPQQAPQPQAPGMGGTQTPLNPFGAPPMLAWQAGQGDAGAMEAYKTFLANQAATPEMKNNAAFGITPDMARSMAVSKATNEGFHAFTPGESWTNTLTGAGGFAPKLPDNAQPNAAFTPGSPIPSVGVVPGAQPVVQGNATATALGNTSGGVHTVTNPDGSQTTGPGANLFQIPPAQQAAENAESVRMMQNELADPKLSPQDRAAVQNEISRLQATGSPTGLPQAHTVTGPNASFQPMVAQGGKLLGDAQNEQKNNQSTYAYLDEMKQLASSGAAFGPGTANIAHWKALANNYVPGIDLTGAQTNQDVMHKLASTLAGSQSPRSDADLANWQARYPSGDLTNAAIAQLIPILQKQANITDARANVLTRASAAGLDKLPELANQFNQIASPSLVSDGRSLAQASQGGPQAMAQFLSQYKTAHSDWQERLQKIQKLDGMGAF